MLQEQKTWTYVPKIKSKFGGTWLAQLVEYVTLDLRVLQFKPYVACGAYLIKKKKKKQNFRTTIKRD